MAVGYEPLVERLRDAAGATPEPSVAASYVEKVRHRASAITEQDVEGLREGGLSEDEVFELTVAAAVGAGLERLAAALEVVP